MSTEPADVQEFERESGRNAIARFWLFALLSFASAMLGTFSMLALPSDASASVELTIQFVIAAVTTALQIGSSLFLLLGLRSFSTLDPRAFSRSAKLTSFLVIAYSIGLVGSLVILAQILNPEPNTLIENECLSLVGFGVVVGLVGLVGAALGLWRAGVRYNSFMVKFATFLFVLSYDNFIPFISIAAAILMIWGIAKIRKADSATEGVVSGAIDPAPEVASGLDGEN